MRSIPNNMRMLPSRSLFSGINRGLIAETGVVPPGLRLLQDTYSFEVLNKKNTVTEDVHGREIPVMKVIGLFQRGNVQNANGRVYSTNDVLAPAVRQIQEDVDSRSVMGEYDHPSDAKIHLDRASHLITKLWMEGHQVFGEAEILHNLPCGAALRGLFEHKVRVGISSRGVGDMEVAEHSGHEIYNVMPGYAFVTWDVVAEPSVKGAILNIQESLNKKTRGIRESKSSLSQDTYNKLLVKAINEFYGLNKKK